MSSNANAATARKITAAANASSPGVRWETSTQGPNHYRVVLKDDAGLDDSAVARAARNAMIQLGFDASWSFARPYVGRIAVMTVVDTEAQQAAIAEAEERREAALEAARAEVAAVRDADHEQALAEGAHAARVAAEAAWEEEAHAAGFASGDDYAEALTAEPEWFDGDDSLPEVVSARMLPPEVTPAAVTFTNPELWGAPAHRVAEVAHALSGGGQLAGTFAAEHEAARRHLAPSVDGRVAVPYFPYAVPAEEVSGPVPGEEPTR
jgi:hypothetical protein